MESGWIINFRDGSKIALDEGAYQVLVKKLNGIRSEEHWFFLENAITNNPGIVLIRRA